MEMADNDKQPIRDAKKEDDFAYVGCYPTV